MTERSTDAPTPPLTRGQANEVLRYWLASLQLEEALSSRPRARRPPLAAPPPRLDVPSPGQDYFKVSLDRGAAALLCERVPLCKPFDVELGAFFESWLAASYRRADDDRELSHLLSFPVVQLARGELAGLLRYGVEVRFGDPTGPAFKVPTRSDRRRKSYPLPPSEARLSAAERGARQWPFFIDTRLLHQQLGVSRERIDALFAALRARAELSESQMLALVCDALEAELAEADSSPQDAEAAAPAESAAAAESTAAAESAAAAEPRTEPPLDALSRLTGAVRRLLARSGGRARVYPVGIVLDSTRAKTTWHLQRELQLLLEERPEVAWELDSCLAAYLTGRALPSGMAVQRAQFGGPALSPSQRFAAERSWGSPLCAVQGPPGTGKTTLILQLAAESVVRQVDGLLDRGSMGDGLLVVASTNNRAVDNVVDPLGSGGSGLPLALRAGSQRLCEHVLAPQLAQARAWLERAGARPERERAEALAAALAHFAQQRAGIAAGQAGRARGFELDNRRDQLRCELAELPAREAGASAPQLDAARTAALEKPLAKARERLSRLGELCDGVPSLPQLMAVDRHYRASAKRALPALEQACADAELPLALGLPPDLPPSTDPAELLEAWQAAADAALAMVEGLQKRIAGALAERLQRKRAEALRGELDALEREQASVAPPSEVPEDDDAQRALFEAAVSVREAWAAVHADELRMRVGAAHEAARVDCSLRPLWGDERGWRQLRQLFGVWGCTLLSLGNCFPARSGAIERLVVDEAGQCHPIHGVSGLLRARTALIIGDVHQLEPVIELEPDDDERAIQSSKIGLSARALAPYRVHGSSRASVQALADRAVTDRPRLIDHYRCQPEIIAICDALCSYGLQVHTPRRAPAAPLPFLPEPVSFVDVVGEQQRLGGSWHNPAELERTLELFEALLGCGIEPRDIAVITPYRGQLEQLRKRVARLGVPIDRSSELLDLEDGRLAPEQHGVALGTVHRFQGGERSIVLFSSVASRRASLGFLDERPNLLNVAVSRARHRFIALGDRALLATGRRTSLLTRAAAPLEAEAFRMQLGLSL